MIELERLSKSYDGDRSFAVEAVDMSIEEGAFLVLLGESGCGKTTTLKMINRLVEPSAGRVTIAGEDVARLEAVTLRRRIGYVFQGIGLFPHRTVAENVATVPELLGWRREDIDARVAELLELVGLPSAEFGDRYPAGLSGGQQQRVGVARALAARARILLMDEPFGALDPLTRDGLQTELKTLQERLGLTIVMVTHDMTEALLLADRIAVMKDGRMRALDTPRALLSAPQDDYVRSLMAMPKNQADRVEAIAEGPPTGRSG